MMNNDLVYRKDVEQMLARIGGCDATEEYERGFDEAIDAALDELRKVKAADGAIGKNLVQKIDFYIKCYSQPPYGREVEGTVELLEEVKEVLNKQPKQSEWIPCSERLPEPYESVLVTAKMKEDPHPITYQGIRCGDSFELSGVMNSTDYIATAWRPEPEPWEGEE